MIEKMMNDEIQGRRPQMYSVFYEMVIKAQHLIMILVYYKMMIIIMNMIILPKSSGLTYL